jgi:hypothetical protein
LEPGPDSRHPGHFDAMVTVRRFLPFRRRRLNTARPAFVLIRSRNPCVRFRLTLLG